MIYLYMMLLFRVLTLFLFIKKDLDATVRGDGGFGSTGVASA